jgi:hypothetical protein
MWALFKFRADSYVTLVPLGRRLLCNIVLTQLYRATLQRPLVPLLDLQVMLDSPYNLNSGLYLLQFATP